jgi:hypothetical protein
MYSCSARGSTVLDVLILIDMRDLAFVCAIKVVNNILQLYRHIVEHLLSQMRLPARLVAECWEY